MAEKATASADGEAGGTVLKKKHQDVETQNLEKVTDYVEEAENSEELGKVSYERTVCFRSSSI